MSMPVQLKRQPSEEKENGVGHIERSESLRSSESPVKQRKGTRFPPNNAAMVSDPLRARGGRCISPFESDAFGS